MAKNQDYTGSRRPPSNAAFSRSVLVCLTASCVDHTTTHISFRSPTTSSTNGRRRRLEISEPDGATYFRPDQRSCSNYSPADWQSVRSLRIDGQYPSAAVASRADSSAVWREDGEHTTCTRDVLTTPATHRQRRRRERPLVDSFGVTRLARRNMD